MIKTNKEECEKILFNCVNIIFNINTLLKPYLPFSSDKVENYLNEPNNKWKYKTISKVDINKDINPLYERYDKSKIEEEKVNYKNNN